MANFGGQRELFMAAPATEVDTNATITSVTITASEPVDIDLDRLVIQAGKDGASEEEGPANDFVNEMRIASLKIRNSIQLIRGQNTVVCPAAPFSGVRGIPSGINFGVWRLETGDTVEFDLTILGTGLSSSVSLGAPCLPCNSRGPNPARPSWNPTYTGSPVKQLAKTASGDIVMTFDADGLVDLDSLIVSAASQSDQAAVQGMPLAAEATVGLTGLALPSGDALVIGKNTPSAPLQAWAPARSFTWSRFGLYQVNAGSTVTASVTLSGLNTYDLQMGARFYPNSGPANKGGCY